MGFNLYPPLLSFSLYLSLSLSLSLCLHLYISPSLSLPLYLSLSLSPSLSLSLPLSISPSLSLVLSLALSFSLSPSHSITFSVTCPGLLVLICLLPVNVWVASRQKVLLKRNLTLKDARITMMNEILSGIKVKFHWFRFLLGKKRSSINTSCVIILIWIGGGNILILLFCCTLHGVRQNNV